MLHVASEDHLLLFSRVANQPLHLVKELAGADQQKTHFGISGQRSDRLGQSQHPVPRTKSSDEAAKYFTFGHSQPLTNLKSSDAGSKLFRIDAVRVNDDFFIRNSGALKVAPLNIGDDENTGRGFQDQTLEPVQQRKHARQVPVLSIPDF